MYPEVPSQISCGHFLVISFVSTESIKIHHYSLRKIAYNAEHKEIQTFNEMNEDLYQSGWKSPIFIREL